MGVAVADLETRFARPLEVIDTRSSDPVVRITEIAREIEATKIVIGRPIGLSGHAGAAVDKQQVLVNALRQACDVEIVEHDERMTSVIADRALREAGKKTKDARAIRDAVAAQVMLQDYMDTHR